MISHEGCIHVGPEELLVAFGLELSSSFVEESSVDVLLLNLVLQVVLYLGFDGNLVVRVWGPVGVVDLLGFMSQVLLVLFAGGGQGLEVFHRLPERDIVTIDLTSEEVLEHRDEVWVGFLEGSSDVWGHTDAVSEAAGAHSKGLLELHLRGVHGCRRGSNGSGKERWGNINVISMQLECENAVPVWGSLLFLWFSQAKST